MLGIADALGGMTISAAARAAGMERQALGDAIKRYNAEGLDGLFDRAKPGRRVVLRQAEKEPIELLIEGPESGQGSAFRSKRPYSVGDC